MRHIYVQEEVHPQALPKYEAMFYLLTFNGGQVAILRARLLTGAQGDRVHLQQQPVVTFWISTHVTTSIARHLDFIKCKNMAALCSATYQMEDM